jgi:hypothetical protein
MWECPAGLFCGGSGGVLGLGKLGKKDKNMVVRGCARATPPPLHMHTIPTSILYVLGYRYGYETNG